MIRLQQMRIDALLSAEQLGDAAGVSGNAIRRVERTGRASLAVLEKLAAYFEVAPSSLLLEARDPGAMSGAGAAA